MDNQSGTGRRIAWNSGTNSTRTNKAFALIAEGMTPYAAALKAGIALSTIYRALKRKKAPAT